MGNNQSEGQLDSENSEFQAVVPFQKNNSDQRKLKRSVVNKVRPSGESLDGNNASPEAGGKPTRPRLDRIPSAKDADLMESHLESGDYQLPTVVESSGGQEIDFRFTEGYSRRNLMADCEFVCSEIMEYLFVGGSKIATSWEALSANKITRVINCSASVVDNCFIDKPNMKYLTLNMVDGRQDDISWFMCEVFQFIFSGRLAGEKTLLHCEKGISRSCSFAIAYRMWCSGARWKEAFDFVKQRRKVCAPNTAFTCNLIEIDELLSGDAKTNSIMLRCSSHLPHDNATPVLKMCRHSDSRKFVTPTTSVLDPSGVYLVRPAEEQEETIYVWQGSLASSATAKVAQSLARHMRGVLTRAENIVIVKQGAEPEAFFTYVARDGPFQTGVSVSFDDLYVATAVGDLTTVSTSTCLQPAPPKTGRGPNNNPRRPGGLRQDASDSGKTQTQLTGQSTETTSLTTPAQAIGVGVVEDKVGEGGGTSGGVGERGACESSELLAGASPLTHLNLNLQAKFDEAASASGPSTATSVGRHAGPLGTAPGDDSGAAPPYSPSESAKGRQSGLAPSSSPPLPHRPVNVEEEEDDASVDYDQLETSTESCADSPVKFSSSPAMSMQVAELTQGRSSVPKALQLSLQLNLGAVNKGPIPDVAISESENAGGTGGSHGNTDSSSSANRRRSGKESEYYNNSSGHTSAGNSEKHSLPGLQLNLASVKSKESDSSMFTVAQNGTASDLTDVRVASLTAITVGGRGEAGGEGELLEASMGSVGSHSSRVSMETSTESVEPLRRGSRGQGSDVESRRGSGRNSGKNGNGSRSTTTGTSIGTSTGNRSGKMESLQLDLGSIKSLNGNGKLRVPNLQLNSTTPAGTGQDSLGAAGLEVTGVQPTSRSSSGKNPSLQLSLGVSGTGITPIPSAQRSQKSTAVSAEAAVGSRKNSAVLRLNLGEIDTKKDIEPDTGSGSGMSEALDGSKSKRRGDPNPEAKRASGMSVVPAAASSSGKMKLASLQLNLAGINPTAPSSTAELPVEFGRRSDIGSDNQKTTDTVTIAAADIGSQGGDYNSSVPLTGAAEAGVPQWNFSDDEDEDEEEAMNAVDTVSNTQMLPAIGTAAVAGAAIFVTAPALGSAATTSAGPRPHPVPVLPIRTLTEVNVTASQSRDSEAVKPSFVHLPFVTVMIGEKSPDHEPPLRKQSLRSRMLSPDLSLQSTPGESVPSINIGPTTTTAHTHTPTHTPVDPLVLRLSPRPPSSGGPPSRPTSRPNSRPTSRSTSLALSPAHEGRYSHDSTTLGSQSSACEVTAVASTSPGHPSIEPLTTSHSGYLLNKLLSDSAAPPSCERDVTPRTGSRPSSRPPSRTPTPAELTLPNMAMVAVAVQSIKSAAEAGDKLPVDVGLVRGPTPVEELSPVKVTVDSGIAAGRGTSAALTARGGSPAVPLLTRSQAYDGEDLSNDLKSVGMLQGVRPTDTGSAVKPLLYQAVEKGGMFGWEAMGVFDDEDLQEASLLLLLCPHAPHFLWLGSQFDLRKCGYEPQSSVSGRGDGARGDGNDEEDEYCEVTDADVRSMACNIAAGELRHESAVTLGKMLLQNNNNVLVERSGNESELFWNNFNEGY